MSVLLQWTNPYVTCYLSHSCTLCEIESIEDATDPNFKDRFTEIGGFPVKPAAELPKTEFGNAFGTKRLTSCLCISLKTCRNLTAHQPLSSLSTWARSVTLPELRSSICIDGLFGNGRPEFKIPMTVSRVSDSKSTLDPWAR